MRGEIVGFVYSRSGGLDCCDVCFRGVLIGVGGFVLVMFVPGWSWSVSVLVGR